MGDFPSLKNPVIIALKGLPAVGKSYVAERVARWARTPVHFIEDFLTSEVAPGSREEEERRAFGVMCNVVERQAMCFTALPCVVVLKSRLCSTLESDQLMELMSRFYSFHALIIIELRCNNMYRRRVLFNRYLRHKRVSWYLSSLDEVEKASDEYDAHAWDCHFDNSIAQLPTSKRRRVRRLVIDISSSSSSIETGLELNAPFIKVIRYLLEEEAMDRLPNTVSFDEVHRDAVERELNTPRTREKYLCRGERGCVFKCREALESDSRCGACDKPVSGPVYACYYCALVLHKSCAEEPKMVDISNPTPYGDKYDDKEGMRGGREPYRFGAVYACM